MELNINPEWLLRMAENDGDCTCGVPFVKELDYKFDAEGSNKEYINNKVRLVGEDNPYGNDPYYALYPAPEGCSGHRLCCLIFGMSRKDYLDRFERFNLCKARWSMKEARASAASMVVPNGTKRFVLLGSKVSSAFGFKFKPFAFETGLLSSIPAIANNGNFKVFLMLPHPSGRNRLWNEADAIKKTREAMTRFTGIKLC